MLARYSEKALLDPIENSYGWVPAIDSLDKSLQHSIRWIILLRNWVLLYFVYSSKNLNLHLIPPLAPKCPDGCAPMWPLLSTIIPIKVCQLDLLFFPYTLAPPPHGKPSCALMPKLAAYISRLCYLLPILLSTYSTPLTSSLYKPKFDSFPTGFWKTNDPTPVHQKHHIFPTFLSCIRSMIASLLKAWLWEPCM